MTVVAGVLLDDGNCYIASDSAVGDEIGYRIETTSGKWWTFPDCVVGYSGAGLALSRIYASFRSRKQRNQHSLGATVREVQVELAGENEAIEPIDAELLYYGPEGMHRVSGCGFITGPHPVACVGHGGPLSSAILEATMKPRRLRKRTKSSVQQVVFEAFHIVARRADSVATPFYSDVFRF